MAQNVFETDGMQELLVLVALNMHDDLVQLNYWLFSCGYVKP